MKKVHSLVIGSLVVGSVSLVAGSASASDPMSVSTYPTAVQYLPSKDAATEVIIWGAFAFNNGSFSYTTPACGAVRYKCGADKDLALCRMQWSEIESTIGETNCRGYGQRNVAPKVTLHPADKVSSAPADVWDLGMGTYPVWGLGNCPTMQTMKCEGGPTKPPPPKDAGVPEIDAGPPTPPPDAGKPVEDTNVTPPPPKPEVDSGSTPPVTPAPDAGGAPAATPPPGNDDVGFGCSAGGGSASLGGAIALLAAMGLVRRRNQRV